jgi:hypothetical protein
VKKTLILSCALLAGAAQAAAGPDHYRARTAAELVKVCSTPSSQSDYATAVAFCHGVLAGAYGYYDASVPEAVRFVCLPSNPAPTRSQIAAGFVAWMQSRPNLLNESGVDALFRYAAETYPCKR